jgi:hypothetical protein
MGIRNIYFDTGAGSFTLPVDFDASQPLLVTCIGSGGGGARRSTSGGGGGGGGGGSLARGSFSGLKPSNVIFFSVGAGGAGGTTNGANGSTGQATWVNISTNGIPANSAVGVFTVGGGGGTGGTGGAGGLASSSIGGLGTATGGAGGTGGANNGSGGGGGGSSGNWNGATTYATGFNGGNGLNVSGDGGGGGGGGVNGAGTSASSINGGGGGLNYSSASASGGSGTSGTPATLGGGGGGGAGRNTNSAFAFSGGFGGSTSVNTGTGAASSGWSGGGGGGGGGSNNSGSTGGGGGGGGYGAGGGGGGSGVTNAGSGGSGGSGLVLLTYTTKETMLASTGALATSTVRDYYGGSTQMSMSQYYRNGSLVPALAENASNVAVPASGSALAMSNFRGSPFKLYREIRSGFSFFQDKFTYLEEYGFINSTPIGAINNTAFTLSGGAGVAITGLYWQYFDDFGNITTTLTFSLSSTSAVSNTGWNSMIFNNGTTFTRSSASFSAGALAANWVWTTATNPFLSGTRLSRAGQTNMIYFV